MTVVCLECTQAKEVDEFAITQKNPDGPEYRSKRCKQCSNKAKYKNQIKDPMKRQKLRDKVSRNNAKEKLQRSTGKRKHYWVWRDSLQSDRAKGRENNLTAAVVENLLGPCTYCGDDDVLQMSLDRKDNTVGHTLANVVPCCVRCNLLRRDMPYEAWLVVAKAVREAYTLGLFGDWLKKRFRHGK